MTTLVVATTLLVHASWGPPVLLAVLLLAAVVAATGISTLVATLAKTVEQAGGLNAIVALSLAAIGGVFIPLSQAPELLGPDRPDHPARLVPPGHRHDVRARRRPRRDPALGRRARRRWAS